MPELSKKLDRFTAAILAEATAETERAMADLREKREAAFSAAEDQILLEAYHYIRGEVARIKAEAGRQVSRHMLENKRTLYLRREEIAHEVFGLVEQKIADFTRTSAYAKRLQALYLEAVKPLAGADDLRVYLREADQNQIPALQAAAPSIQAEFAEGRFHVGGLIAESQRLGLWVDSTYDSAMAELSGHFAELFGLSLADEE